MNNSPTEIRRTWTIALSLLVVSAMMVGTLVVVTPLSAVAATTPRGGPGTSGIQASAQVASTCGEVAVPLGSASSFAALSGAGITNTGPSALNGNLGVGPGSSVTGFPPGTFTGTEYVGDAVSAAAEANLTIAYNNASGRSNCAVTVAGNIGGRTLTPGLYKSTSSLAISSGDLTLNGGGNPNGVFIFEVASALTTTSGRAVVLTNGAQAGNVYWAIGSSATLGTTSKMQGTLMAYASITLATGAHLTGRALARTGDVTLASNAIVVPTVTTASTYTVTFTESGLTSGTSWSATLDGASTSSVGTTIGFTLADGSYGFQIGAMARYAATPASGTVAVSGSDVGRAISFSASGASGTWTVTFTERGLDKGTNWSVAMDGGLVSSLTTEVAFAATDGTHAYTIAPMSGSNATPSSGNVTVSGASVGQAVSFGSPNGTGPGGGNGGGGGYLGVPAWGWLLIGIAVVAAVIAGVALLVRQRGKPTAPTPP
jgi:hypothetical protein